LKAIEGVEIMIEPRDNPDLDNRPFSLYHLSGKKFLEWAESKDYELPHTNPPLSNEVPFQVEWFLAEMMRSTSKNLTGEKLFKRAKSILQKNEEKILEGSNALGKAFLGSLKHDGGFPENRDPLAQFFMGSQRQKYWRNLISDAVYLDELVLLDYPSLGPITEKQKNEVLSKIFQQVNGPLASDDVATANEGAQPNWKMRVQAEATAMCLRLIEQGAQPNPNNIVDSLAAWCRKPEIDLKTNTGTHPSAGYIRTHVISGKHWKIPTKNR
jgi:hypothetical protein